MDTPKTVVKMKLRSGLTHFRDKVMNSWFGILPIRFLQMDPKEF